MSIFLRTQYRPFVLAAFAFIMFACLAFITRDHKGQKEYTDDPVKDSLAWYFKNPPSQYSLLPFWSWNNTLIPEKLNWQMDQMIDKGIYGAFMHARSGLDESETPYFSPGWWTAVESTVKHAHETGFQACLYDEDKWPSGSAGGRTIQTNPKEFTKKALYYSTMDVQGPQSVQINFPGKPLAIFAAPLGKNGEYNHNRQIELTQLWKSVWQAPAGHWQIIAFNIVIDPHEQIDYMDSAAVANFLHITHDEYYKRLSPYFGSTIPGVFFDEIYANFSDRKSNIFWTDDFLAQFKKLKGYDLKEKLPLIIFDDPALSAKTRCDFFDVVRTLYSNAWFKQYARWGDEHGIWVTGHTTEMLMHYTRQSDYFYTLGQLQVPCADNEDFRYGFPREIDFYNPKQGSSLAHMYGRNRVAAETMGSGGYGISLEEYKYGFAMLGAYGINMFIPHLFSYSMSRPENQSDWPPSWFYRNPYWKYFKPLAQYAQRISYMMSQGSHHCKVALLYPLTQLWVSGYRSPVEDENYKEIQRLLLEHHIDYDIIDPHSLLMAKPGKAGLTINDETYTLLLLPGLSAIERGAADQLRSFAGQGGTVLALQTIPAASEMAAPADPYIDHASQLLFGFDVSMLKQQQYMIANQQRTEDYVVHDVNGKGHGVFTRYVESIPEIINRFAAADIKIEGDHNKWLRYQHREINGRHIYFLVNGRKDSANIRISFNRTGIPFRWDPATGAITELTNYSTNDQELQCQVQFKPWEAFFIVLEPGTPAPHDLTGYSTSLEDASFTLTSGQIKVEGWSSNDRHELVWEKQGNRYRQEWSTPASPGAISMTGSWDFQLLPHAIDYRWTTQVDYDTLQIPVMAFCKDPAAADKLPPLYDLGQPKGAWKWVKLKDDFSGRAGVQRHLSSWNANWISYYDYHRHLTALEGGTRYFRKIFDLSEPVQQAVLDIAADKTYTVYINNRLLGSDSFSSKAEHYDITSFLRKGANQLIIVTSNTRALLAEAEIRSTSSKLLRLATGEDWQASPDSLNWSAAFTYAMPALTTWGNLERPGRPLKYPLTVWYKQILPPGAYLLLPPAINGNYRMSINGKKIRTQQNKPLNLKPYLSSTSNWIELEVQVHNGEDGLREPLQLLCGKSVISDLESWNSMGLGWYSGRALYSKTVQVPAAWLHSNQRCIIDPGRLNYFAEIWVNGQLVRFAPWPPFRTDISSYLKPGENRIEIVVANMLVNRASWNMFDANIDDKDARWWHWGSINREKQNMEAGLLGPVRIISQQKVSKIFSVVTNSVNP